MSHWGPQLPNDAWNEALHQTYQDNGAGSKEFPEKKFTIQSPKKEG